MEIDKRYLELLADTVPFKSNYWLRRAAYLAVVLIVVGALLLFNGLNRPIDNQEAKDKAIMLMNSGLVLTGSGLVLVGIAIFFKNKERLRSRKVFLEYYDKNNQLPPWPSDSR